MPQLSGDQAQNITAFYFCYVKPISGNYSRFTLEGLANRTGRNIPKHKQKVALTSTEAILFIRATYHFELFRQLAQPREVET